MSGSESDGESDTVIIHRAKIITDWKGRIFKPAVLDIINVGNIVRLSIIVTKPIHDMWSHDAPYVEIMSVEDKKILGSILDKGRVKECNKYPLLQGERIRFSAENIIEIPLKDQPNGQALEKFITTESVSVTGPLYTIEYLPETTYDSDSDSDSDSNSYSD
jgi:hypothetical protein